MSNNSDSNIPREGENTKISSNPEFDRFWNTWSRESIGKTLAELDSRAKFMITTSATLLVINFGVLLIFKSGAISIAVGPPFLFLLSAIFFVISFFPVQRPINIETPYESHKAFGLWRDSKIRWHKTGFIFFLLGLGLMAIAAVVHHFD